MTSFQLTAVPLEAIAGADAHEAARTAWLSAETGEQVAVARELSRAASMMAMIDAEWLEQLEAACRDAEAGHAADLHDHAAKRLRCASTPARCAGR